MGSKGLGITMIQMYCDMIDDEFNPLIAILKTRTAGIEGAVERKVKKDLGAYDLIMERAVLEEKISEIDNKIKSLTKETWGDAGGGEWSSAVSREVKRRLEQMNEPLTQAQAKRESLKKSIRLSGSPGAVAELFEKLSKEMESLINEAKSLPPIPEILGIEGVEEADAQISRISLR